MAKADGLLHAVDVPRPTEWLTLHGRIRDVLDRRGWPAGKVSEAAGFARTYLSTQLRRMEEQGHDMTVGTVLKLAGVLRVSAGWLASNEGWPDEEIRRDVERFHRSRSTPPPPMVRSRHDHTPVPSSDAQNVRRRRS
jgi:hypothetical protein